MALDDGEGRSGVVLLVEASVDVDLGFGLKKIEILSPFKFKTNGNHHLNHLKQTNKPSIYKSESNLFSQNGVGGTVAFVAGVVGLAAEDEVGLLVELKMMLSL